MRVPFAISLVLLAATPLLAVPPTVKPPAPGADSDREAWRGQEIGLCVGEMRQTDGVSPDELEATCGCAVDRFIAGRRTDALPALGPGLVRSELSGSLIACAGEQRIAAATALANRLAEAQRTPSPPANAESSKPDGQIGSPDPSRASRSWSDGLSLPGWLTDSGLPVWAWVLLGFTAFMVIRGLFRGGEQKDLIGPPRSMRMGTQVTPPAPRRPDPPQRS